MELVFSHIPTTKKFTLLTQFPTEPLAESPTARNPEKCFSITHFALPVLLYWAYIFYAY